MRNILWGFLIFILWMWLWLGRQESLDNDEDYEFVVKEHVSIDLEKIKKRGRLVALTRYNANSFFIYRGRPMGYEYELLRLFTREIGVELEIKIPSTHDSLFIMLENGEGDIIAANLPITKEKGKRVLFSEPHNTTRLVLIQKLPENHRFMNERQMRERLITDQVELIGKTVTVRQNSAQHRRLQNLAEEIGGEIFINLLPLEQEDLIGMVSRGEIEFTIADENLALLNRAYHGNIDVSLPVSFPHRLAWAMRHSSPELKEAVDTWLARLRRGPHFNIIYNRYYNNPNMYARRRSSEFFVLQTGAISPYDSLFQANETPPLLPWTLLAAIAYQESRFNNAAVSWMGARGIMQLMPGTARDMGFPNVEYLTPAQNIRAGSMYLQWLYNHFWRDMTDTTEMIKFILASYNAGPGSVRDAQRLAASLGLNPNVWDDNVAEAILKLSNPRYFYRPYIRHGFVRGEEPFQYVRQIMARWKMYENILEAVQRRAAETVAGEAEVQGEEDDYNMEYLE